LNEHHIQSKWAAHDDSIEEETRITNLVFEKVFCRNLYRTTSYGITKASEQANDNGSATRQHTSHSITST
jgi:hypothetical protein